MWENGHSLRALVIGGHVDWDSLLGGQFGTIYANDSATPLLQLNIKEMVW